MIICVVGPTAVGKSKMAVELAKKLNAVVVNCDSMQVYENLNIGTAKVTKEEMDGVKHELLDFVPLDKVYTVYDYQEDARKIIAKYQGKNLIFVGGTGLYLKAALYDYQFKAEDGIRNEYEDLSNEELYRLALDKDKDILIHPNNRQRLVRFLNKSGDSNVISVPLYEAIYVGLTTDRDNLYTKINDRVDKMFKEGLLEEVKSLYEDGIRSKALMTGIGYKELYDYFDGFITLDEAKDLIKKRSRHYAKRQYTFFNHQLPVKWFNTNYDDFSKTVNEVWNYIKEDVTD